jgi:peptide/nickel transport system substrate-binding protein
MSVTASVIRLGESDTPVSLRDYFEFGAIGLVCAGPGTDSYVDFRCDYELWGCENGILLYLACNEKSKVLSDPALRAALTYAIDRESLVTRFYGDFAAAATLPASPQSPYYSEKLAKQYGYDPQKYQQLVTEANGSGKELTLLVNSADSRRIRVAHRIAEMLSAGGLRITVKALRDNSYTNALTKGNYDLHLGQTKLSSNMDLTPFFAPGGSLNFGSLSDAGIYSLCQEALANMGNYYTLHQKVMQSGMLIPILFRSYAVYTQRGLVPELNPAKDYVFYYEVIKN